MRFNPGTSIRTKGGKKLFQLGLMALRIIHICTCQGPPWGGGLPETQALRGEKGPETKTQKQPFQDSALPDVSTTLGSPATTFLRSLSLDLSSLQKYAMICNQKESQNNITNQLLLDFGKFLHLLNPNFLIRMSVTIPASLKGCNESPVKGRLWPPFKNCKNL